MDKDRIAGNWKQLRGKVKEQWGKLTDNEIDQLEGHADMLAGLGSKCQERPRQLADLGMKLAIVAAMF